MLTLPSINQSINQLIIINKAYIHGNKNKLVVYPRQQRGLTTYNRNTSKYCETAKYDLFRLPIDRPIDRSISICETKYKTARILFKTWQQRQLLCYSIQMSIHWHIMTQTNYHTHSSDRFGDKTNPPKVVLRRPTACLPACLSVNQSINGRFAPTAYTRESLPPNQHQRLPWHFISREEHNGTYSTTGVVFSTTLTQFDPTNKCINC